MSSPAQIEKLSKLYDYLYNEADNLLKEFNPCKVKLGACTTCVGTRSGNIAGVKDGVLCCGGCKYLTNTGCSVKALTCKLWLCYTTYKHNKLLAEKLHTLRIIACAAKLTGFRTSKEDVFKYITQTYAL